MVAETAAVLWAVVVMVVAMEEEAKVAVVRVAAKAVAVRAVG